MRDYHVSGRQMVDAGGRFLGHSIAVVAGLVLMIVGVAMGVTMVLLPLGIPVGLVGLLIFVWGLTAGTLRRQARHRQT